VFSICWVLSMAVLRVSSRVCVISSSTVICWVYLFVMVCVAGCLVYRVYGGWLCVSVDAENPEPTFT